jgi:competence protein ComEC
MGIAVYDTALQGALRVQLGAYQPLQGWRAQRRFWRDPVLPP